MISSYRNSYFNPKDYSKHGKALACVRAGAIIGGGDWSENRLIPDCIRFIEAGKDIKYATQLRSRPWEHVLEPLSGYYALGKNYLGILLPTPPVLILVHTFLPTKPVLEVVQRLVQYYGKGKVIDISDPNAVHENVLLSVDVTKAYIMLNWQTKWGLQDAIKKTRRLVSNSSDKR